MDNENAIPGFRVQYLSSRIEHSSTIRRPESDVSEGSPTVGLLDQPVRSRRDLVCLTAVHEVNGQMAYLLYDSGSTTNSLTPEFAHATDAPRIKLKDQVTLQLGCVGSRSRINYGTRVPINFGGIKGYTYFDQVNLDRYDGIIGTPFLNRHGVVLDFKNRTINYPNGKIIKALTILEEAALISGREAMRKGKGMEREASSIPLSGHN
ncbi:hypothetical protein C8R43DRAFT_909771 [Mycena crocata]|nr:hypothetical protein C8R43DRAFT_909771 [Mycena crocata]